jgi:hypothetical protein
VARLRESGRGESFWSGHLSRGQGVERRNEMGSGEASSFLREVHSRCSCELASLMAPKPAHRTGRQAGCAVSHGETRTRSPGVEWTSRATDSASGSAQAPRRLGPCSSAAQSHLSQASFDLDPICHAAAATPRPCQASHWSGFGTQMEGWCVAKSVARPVPAMRAKLPAVPNGWPGHGWLGAFGHRDPPAARHCSQRHQLPNDGACSTSKHTRLREPDGRWADVTRPYCRPLRRWRVGKGPLLSGLSG